MPASITLKIRLGPFVSFEVIGESCTELAAALQGYQTLNSMIDAMCSDLAERVYPEGMEAETEQGEEVQQ